MTKLPNLILKQHAVLLTMLLVANLTLADIGVPTPEDQLQQADLVAVGTIQEATESGGQPVFTATKILKGNITVGKGYGIDSPSGEVLRTIPDLIRRAENKPFLLVAKFDQRSQKIWPVYGAGCVWPSPQDLPMDMRTPATLKECIAFASSAFHLPDRNQSKPNVPTSEVVHEKPLEGKSVNHLERQIVMPPSKDSASAVSKPPVVGPNETAKVSMSWPLGMGIVFVAVAVLYFAARRYSRKLTAP